MYYQYMQTVVLKVGMSCQGCVGAVNRVLGKMEGIFSKFLFHMYFILILLIYQLYIYKYNSCVLYTKPSRIYQTISGVESFDIDIKEQKVTVKGKVEPEAVFQTVSKTGKKTSYWPVETEAEPKAEVEPKAETETKAEAETKTEGKVVEVLDAKVDATKVEPEANVEPKFAETETKTEGKADDEVLDAKVDPKVDAKADVEPKLVEAETKPPQV